MKNIIKNTLIIIILFLLYQRRLDLINGALSGLNIWKNNLFPSIFPILILSDYILSSNIISIISNLFGHLFNKLFKVSKYSSYLFIMSFISGCPSNAKYIHDLYKQNIISLNEANKILSMTLLYNPLLILSITSYLKLKDQIYLIVINLIANILIGLINRNIPCNINNTPIKYKEFNLIDSLISSINTLLLILSVIVLFMIINSIIPIKHPLITGLLEITSGIHMLNNYNVLYQYKIIFTAFLMSFGGFSILIQIKSIFKDTNINYSLYYKSRIIHLIIMLLLCYLKILIN